MFSLRTARKNHEKNVGFSCDSLEAAGENWKKKCDFADGFFKNHRDKKTTGFPDGFEEIVEKDNKSKHKKAYFFRYFSQYRPEY